MKTGIAALSAFLTGVIISIMVVANTELGNATTNEVSMIVNQSIGVVLVTLILLMGKNNPLISPPRQKSRWYMYFGGLFGIFVMVFNFYSVLNIGSALAMACAVFGQSLMALFLDIFGLFGMKKQQITVKKALSTGISFAGILVMSLSQTQKGSLIYILMAVAAGVFTMLQFCYNSGFAKKKGALFSARQNALSGLAGTLVYAFILLPEETLAGFRNLPSVPFLSIILGGCLAIVVVSASNLIIPAVPAVYSSLLISAGQILSSLALDAFFYSRFSLPMLTGAVIMLAGVLLDYFAGKSLNRK